MTFVLTAVAIRVLAGVRIGTEFTATEVTRPFVAVLLFTAFGYGVVFEVGYLSSSSVPLANDVYHAGRPLAVNNNADGELAPWRDVKYGELITAGQKISQSNVDTASRVTFAGTWKHPGGQYQSAFLASRVLIYSDLLPRARNLSATEATGCVSTKEAATECALVV